MPGFNEQMRGGGQSPKTERPEVVLGSPENPEEMEIRTRAATFLKDYLKSEANFRSLEPVPGPSGKIESIICMKEGETHTPAVLFQVLLDQNGNPKGVQNLNRAATYDETEGSRAEH